jgi:hypothetical protein
MPDSVYSDLCCACVSAPAKGKLFATRRIPEIARSILPVIIDRVDTIYTAHIVTAYHIRLTTRPVSTFPKLCHYRLDGMLER